MYPFTLKKTEEKQYTCLPSPLIDRLVPWLDKNGVDYEILTKEEVPDWVPQGCQFFHGRPITFGYAYLYANLDPKELTETAEKMHYLGMPAFRD